MKGLRLLDYSLTLLLDGGAFGDPPGVLSPVQRQLCCGSRFSGTWSGLCLVLTKQYGCCQRCLQIYHQILCFSSKVWSGSAAVLWTTSILGHIWLHGGRVWPERLQPCTASSCRFVLWVRIWCYCGLHYRWVKCSIFILLLGDLWYIRTSITIHVYGKCSLLDRFMNF